MIRHTIDSQKSLLDDFCFPSIVRRLSIDTAQGSSLYEYLRHNCNYLRDDLRQLQNQAVVFIIWSSY